MNKVKVILAFMVLPIATFFIALDMWLNSKGGYYR